MTRRAKPVASVRPHVRIGSALELGPDWPHKALEQLMGRLTYGNPARAKLKAIGRTYAAQQLPPTIEHYDFNSTTGVLRVPRGATAKVRQIAQAHGLEPIWFDQRLELPRVRFDLRTGANRVELWPHQREVIRACIAHENCLIRAATGSGKTDAALELIRIVGQPTLVIVWTAGLVNQWVERICERWGWSPRDVGVIGGGKANVGAITIALQQSLNPGRCAQIAPMIGMAIADECQRVGSPTLRDVVATLPARYRIGLSADERRKDRMDFLIHDLFGPVAAEVKREKLEAKKLLCPVDFVLIPTEFRMPELDACPVEERIALRTRLYPQYLSRISMDAPRSEIALGLAADLHRKGESVLIFCNRIELAKQMAAFMRDAEDVPCGLMIGGAPNRKAFEDAKAKLRSGELRCAIGSSAIYQGEDIPRLTTGIVVTPTGSNRQLLEQQVGRLRRNAEGKTKGRLYYLWDEHVVPEHLDNLTRWYGSKAVQVARTRIPA